MGKEFSIRVRRMKRRVEDREEGIDNVVEYAIQVPRRRFPKLTCCAQTAG
jgi:hypothetical protein